MQHVPAPYFPAPYFPAPYFPAPYFPAPYFPVTHSPAPYSLVTYFPAFPDPYVPVTHSPAPYVPAPYVPVRYPQNVIIIEPLLKSVEMAVQWLHQKPCQSTSGCPKVVPSSAQSAELLQPNDRIVEDFVSHFKTLGLDEPRLRRLASTHVTTINAVMAKKGIDSSVGLRDLLTIHSEQSSTTPLDLSGWDLSNRDLSRITISNVNFHGATLSGVNFRGSSFKDCSLNQCIGTKVNLSGVAFHDCQLVGAAFREVTATPYVAKDAWHWCNGFRPYETTSIFSGCDLSQSHWDFWGANQLKLQKCTLKSVTGNWAEKCDEIVDCTMDASVARSLSAYSIGEEGCYEYVPSIVSQGKVRGGRVDGVTVPFLLDNQAYLLDLSSLHFDLVSQSDDGGVLDSKGARLMSTIERLIVNGSKSDGMSRLKTQLSSLIADLK